MTDQENNNDQGGLQSDEVAEFNENARQATPRDPVEQQQQDLHIAQTRGPDKNWPAAQQARMMPASVQPTQERLARKSQFVSVRNSSDRFPGVHGRINPQTHIILDRYQRGIQIQPGETKHNVELLVTDIDHFLRAGLSGRRNDLGQPLPRHPIEIIGVDDSEIARAAKEDERRKKEARKMGKALQEFANASNEPPHDEAEHDDGDDDGDRRSRRPIQRRSSKRS